MWPVALVLATSFPPQVFAQHIARGPNPQIVCNSETPRTLRLSVFVSVRPVWELTPAGACTLSYLDVIRLIGMPDGAVLLDSADQAAYAATVLSRVDETSQFLIARGADTVRFAFSSDSVAFDFELGQRWRFGGRQIMARAEIRDSVFLHALVGASSLEVLTLNPSASYYSERKIWIPDADRWLRKLQVADHAMIRPRPSRDQNAAGATR